MAESAVSAQPEGRYCFDFNVRAVFLVSAVIVLQYSEFIIHSGANKQQIKNKTFNMSLNSKYVCTFPLFFRGQVKFQSDPDSYNGAVRENYSWSQDYSDVEVRVFVPKTVNKGRQVNTHTC